MKRSMLLAGGLSTLAIAAACSSTVTTQEAASTAAVASSSSSSTSSGGPDGGPPADVTGTMVNRYFTEAGVVARAVDLSAGPVEAYVWQGGGWQTYPGSGKADGSFTVPGVPSGLLMVNVAGSYVYTEARALDLGTEIGGRPDAVMASSSDSFTGTLKNVAPFSGCGNNDYLSASNANGGGWASLYGTVSGDAFTVVSATCFGGLVDSSKGDVMYVTQTSCGSSASTILRFAALTGVEQAQGTTGVNGTLKTVEPNESIQIDFRASEFAAQRAAVNPGVMDAGWPIVGVSALPGTANEHTSVSWSSVGLLTVPVLNDTNLGKVQYANPFPASWGTQVTASQQFTVVYTTPLGAEDGLTPSIWVTLPPAQAAAGPIRPLVTPVTSPLVNGMSAFQPLTGISLTPTLSWSPPSVGTPTGYLVEVYDLDQKPASILQAVSIATTTTSLPLPPGVLQMGHGYAFTVRAIVSAVDAATKPFHTTVPSAGADMLTAMMQP